MRAVNALLVVQHLEPFGRIFRLSSGQTCEQRQAAMRQASPTPRTRFEPCALGGFLHFWTLDATLANPLSADRVVNSLRPQCTHAQQRAGHPDRVQHTGVRFQQPHPGRWPSPASPPETRQPAGFEICVRNWARQMLALPQAKPCASMCRSATVNSPDRRQRQLVDRDQRHRRPSSAKWTGRPGSRSARNWKLGHGSE